MISDDLSEILETTISELKNYRQRNKLESKQSSSRLPVKGIHFCEVAGIQLSSWDPVSLFHRFCLFLRDVYFKEMLWMAAPIFFFYLFLASLLLKEQHRVKLLAWLVICTVGSLGHQLFEEENYHLISFLLFFEAVDQNFHSLTPTMEFRSYSYYTYALYRIAK